MKSFHHRISKKQFQTIGRKLSTSWLDGDRKSVATRIFHVLVFSLATLWLTSIVLLPTYGCIEIIEEILSDSTMSILSPVDSAHYPQGSVLFWWEHLEGADNYRLQVVSPSFDAIHQLVVDTPITGDKFTLSLDTGWYQWRIRAENTISQSIWDPRVLKIDTLSSKRLSAKYNE